MISIFSDVFSPLRRQGYDRIADDLHRFPGSTFAGGRPGAGGGMDPTPGEAWPEKAAAACHDIQLLSKNHRRPEAGPFSAGGWTSIHGPLTTGTLRFEDGGNSIPECYSDQGMASNTFCSHTDEENISLDSPSAVRNRGRPSRCRCIEFRNERYNFVVHA